MNQKKKILYVVTQGEWGGAQRYIADLAHGMPAEWNITVAVGEPKGRHGLLERCKDRCATVQLRHLVRRISPFRDMLAFFELRRLFSSLKPDIIHLNSSKAGVLGSLAARSLRGRHVPIVYTAHGWVFDEPLSPGRKKAYLLAEKITARMKDATILLSRHDSMRARDMISIPKKKMHIIPHGIAAPAQTLSREEARRILCGHSSLADTNNAKVWVGCIANYYPAKGIDILIDAIATLSDAKEKLHCFLIGEGPERHHLEQTIAHYGLSGTVTLSGAIQDAATLLPAFDLFVLPSKKEGLPYALLEAMSLGIPIVATDAGGVPELIQNKKTGLLAPAQHTAALAASIRFALSHPAEMKRMAEDAKKDAGRFSVSAMTASTLALYSRISRETK